MKQRHGKFIGAMALGLWLACSGSVQAEPTGIALKMADYLDSMIQSGVDTLDRLRRTNDAESGKDAVPVASPVASSVPPITPAATHMKLDKVNSRFVEKNSEIYDARTKLTWSRCSEGQRWDKLKGCIGIVRQYTFDQAQKLANETWRLPTKSELVSLIDRTKKSTPEDFAIDTIAFPGMDPNRLMYWSSEDEDNSFAWAVMFIDTGVPAILYRSHKYAIRLVRDGQ